MNPETYDTIWDSTNDYSYADLVSFEDDNAAAQITEKITLYANGELIWGEEPDGTRPEHEQEGYVAPVIKETTTLAGSGTTAKTTAKTTETTAKTTATTKLPDATATMYGDANCDGKVNLGDVVLIMQSIANEPKYGLKGSDASHITLQGLANADVYGGGDGVTNMDAQRIQMYLLDLITKLPVE